jgi:hypothetical protein
MVLSEPRVKTLLKKQLSGKNLFDYANNITKSDTPVIKTAFESMCSFECIEAFKEAEDRLI